MGFGVVDVTSRGEYLNPQWGTITTSKDKPEAARLQEIHRDLRELIQHLQPDAVGIEKIFFFRNVKTIIPVTQARGVILLVLEELGVPYGEYTPMQVKQAITGSGKSDKKEIQEMITMMLSLHKIPRPDDAADALGMAVCHYMHTRQPALLPS